MLAVTAFLTLLLESLHLLIKGLVQMLLPRHSAEAWGAVTPTPPCL